MKYNPPEKTKPVTVRIREPYIKILKSEAKKLKISQARIVEMGIIRVMEEK